MKPKIYVDAGFYAGMTLRRYLTAGVIDKDWLIYVFEPNPDYPAEQRIADHFTDIKINLIRKAVWTEDGKVKFEIAGREDAPSIQGTSGHVDPKIVSVPAVDFSKFIANLPEADYILCSMDIEGAEFYVLEKMLKDNTIDKINLLEIEFHHRLTVEFNPDNARDLIKRIEARGVELMLKDALE